MQRTPAHNQSKTLQNLAKFQRSLILQKGPEMQSF